MSAAMRNTSKWTWFTVIPSSFLYTFTLMLYCAIVPNLIQQKVCHPDFPPPVDFVCDNSTLIKEATDIITTRSSIRESLPAIVLLMVGVWKDATFLNKPILYLALLSEAAGVLVELITFLDWGASAWITSISDAIINGLTGGSKLFFIGATYVITDSSENEHRTARITLLLGATFAGACLSTASSGYVLSILGYKWSFIGVIGLYLINSLLILVMVKEVEREEVGGNKWQAIQNLKTVFTSRTNYIVIWLMVISSCLCNTILVAEGNIMLYFLQQNFGFTVEEAGIYSSCNLILMFISSLIVPPAIRLIKWSDYTTGIVSGTSAIVSYVLMALAKTRLELYLAPAVGFMKVFVFSVPKSIVSQCVAPNEVGVYLSICYIGECTLPIVLLPFYDYIFNATVTTLPGAVFLISATAVAVVISFLSISACIYKPAINDCSEDKAEPENEAKNDDHYSSKDPESSK